MSCVSGIHDRLTSSALNRAAWLIPRMFAMRLACVSTTPLGSLVEPEENWMKATSAGRARWGLPLRPSCSSWSTRNARVRSVASVSRSSSLLAGGEALQQSLLGIDIRSAQLARDAQQLAAVLVTEARGYRHRDDAAEHCRPEGVDELLVAGQEQDQLVARPGAEALQVMQDAERALVQLPEAHRTRL